MTFTFEHLHELLRVDDAVALTASNADIAFEELGYDSLALLELSAQLRQQFGIRIPERDLTALRTPRLAVDYLNALSPQARSA